MRTFVKKVETAIAGGNKQDAVAALRAAQPEMQRAAGKGVVAQEHRRAEAVAPVQPASSRCHGLKAVRCGRHARPVDLPPEASNNRGEAKAVGRPP